MIREKAMMGTRYEGKLKKWNADRGFGFIVANDSGQDVFVHISAFSRSVQKPADGDVLTFEVEPDGNGKKRAVRVQYAGAIPPARVRSSKPSSRPRSHTEHQKTGAASKVISLLLIAGLGWFGYSHYSSRVLQISAQAQTDAASPAPPTRLDPAKPVSGQFICDDRKYCSQMTSCEEAKLFLNNCPGVEMDGNHDGVPCEQQWCK